MLWMQELSSRNNILAGGGVNLKKQNDGYCYLNNKKYAFFS